MLWNIGQGPKTLSLRQQIVMATVTPASSYAWPVNIRRQSEKEPGSKKCLDDYMRKCMRHELVHAFLYESGLSINSLSPSGWASNEEMTDWMAIQGPKLYDAWKQAKCL